MDHLLLRDKQLHRAYKGTILHKRKRPSFIKTGWKSHPIQGAGKLPAGVRHSPGESGQLIRWFDSAVPGPAAPGEKGGSAQPNSPDGGRRERRIYLYSRGRRGRSAPGTGQDSPGAPDPPAVAASGVTTSAPTAPGA